MARQNSNALAPERLPFTIPAGDQLLPWLEHKKDVGRSVVSEQSMKLNLAFVLGNQWLVWDGHTKSFRRPRTDTTDPNAPVRLHANKIGTLVERHVAKLTKDAPLPEGRPVSDDDNDVASAKVLTRILEHEMDRLHWDSVLQKFAFWPATLGWSYMHVGWNPTDGNTVGMDPDDPEQALMMGNVFLEEVPAFELRVDPAAQYMSTAKWCVRSSTMTAEEVWEKFDVQLSGGADRSLAQEVYALSPGQNSSPGTAAEWVTVNQLWVLPGKIAPQGAVITWAENEVLERKAFPYDHGTLPFVQLNCLPGIGTREGRTFVSDLIDPQTDYNDALSREATIRRTLTPKFVAAVGQVDPARITSRVDVLQYMPGITAQPPHLEMPNAGWAQQFEIAMSRAESDMGDRAGIGDASQGDAASSAPAASILALQDADDTKLRISATELSAFIAEVGRQIALLDKQFWAEERTIRVWSQEDILSAYRYSGADIDDRCDVHVTAESSMPRSKAARSQMILQLAQMFPQLIDPQDVMRAIDMPGFDWFVRSLDVDTRKQNRENSQMLDGEDCKVQPFDNHVIHLKVLNDFRKTSDYENLPIEEQARFDAHAAVHESLVLGQLGLQVPTPQPTQNPAAMQQAQQAQAGPAAGLTPNAQSPEGAGAPYQQPPQVDMSDPSIQAAAGIGQGAGQPGIVPGVPADMQANSMGH